MSGKQVRWEIQTHLGKWDESKEALRTSLNFQAAGFFMNIKSHLFFPLSSVEGPSVLMIISGSVF